MLKPYHLVAALPFVVSACGSGQGPFYAQGCPADAAERVQAADWARVKTITVSAQRDAFDPMIVTLTKGRPYVLRLENGDRTSHFFRAPDFFKAIALESATVGSRELAEPCPVRVTLEAEETAEFRFVAVRDGHYNFEDAMLSFTLRSGASGVITIESRRAFSVGALNPVKIEGPAPAETSAPAQPQAPVETAPSDNPFDTYQPPADDAGKAAPEAEPNPFDTVEPAPAEGAEPNPFDAVEPAPAPAEEPNPFDAVEPAPAPAEEPSPFDAAEPAPAPAEEPSPFDTVEEEPAEADAPGAMAQTMPPAGPAPPPEPEDGAVPFGALEPERSLPME